MTQDQKIAAYLAKQVAVATVPMEAGALNNALAALQWLDRLASGKDVVIEVPADAGPQA